MSRCLSCSREVPDDARFCSSCGSAVGTPTSAPTETSAGSAESAPRQRSPERFLPGTVVAGRYRIIALLGSGGMGEVYRADDLKLGQPVALKFLPEVVERDSSRLDRFLNEVKTALKVTHPNVCRVYDIGEVGPSTPSTRSGQPSSGQASSEQGQHYISMEYVDGEDLASLLRRIGRLPRDKAAQIARQICAGLGAAHEEGIVHRDLKPANVMIDGRGRAKITDFGLASLAGAVRGQEVRAGTPLYMAPEQLAGREVTSRSDLYSLGLVLYELFTGKRAFEAATPTEMLRLEQESAPTNPSSHVEGFDPAVERAILRCLEKEPGDRPGSALSVAAALPGGDPLAAALAAGETPSPEMVAAAGPRGGLRPVTAVICLALVVFGLSAVLWGFPATALIQLLPFDKSFDALKDDAREIASELGYTESPADSEAHFSLDMFEFLHLVRERDPAEARAAVSRRGQMAVYFIYRQAPEPLVPNGLRGRVSLNDPPPAPGDLMLRLDLGGNLAWMRVVPSPADWSAGPDPPPNWPVLFEAAGLDIAEFEATTPTLRPTVYADTRMAWNGVLPDAGDRPVRIEAAALRGKPVYFEKVVPSDSYWSPDGEDERERIMSSFQPINVILLSALALVAAGAVFLAIRNLRLGRGDPKGALRLAFFVFIFQMLYRIVTGHHVAGLAELDVLIAALCGAVTFGLVIYVLYAALEPYVRKLWPESVVSWTRLLAGRFRDPLVGRDVLMGQAMIGALFLFSLPIAWILETLDLSPPFPHIPLDPLRGGRYAVGELFSGVLNILVLVLLLLMLFLLLRILLRRTWIAAAVFVALWTCVDTLQFAAINPSLYAVGILFGLINAIFILTLLIRFGLVAFLAGFVFLMSLNQFPTTADVSAPYFTIGLIPVFVTLALAAYGFHTALAGQAVFRDDLLGVGPEERR